MSDKLFYGFQIQKREFWVLGDAGKECKVADANVGIEISQNRFVIL